MKLFRFEAMGVVHSECKNVIENAWNTNAIQVHIESLMEKINNCSQQLVRWSRNSFKSVRRNLNRAQRELQSLIIADPTHERREDHKRARQEMQN